MPLTFYMLLSNRIDCLQWQTVVLLSRHFRITHFRAEYNTVKPWYFCLRLLCRQCLMFLIQLPSALALIVQSFNLFIINFCDDIQWHTKGRRHEKDAYCINMHFYFNNTRPWIRPVCTESDNTMTRCHVTFISRRQFMMDVWFLNFAATPREMGMYVTVDWRRYFGSMGSISRGLSGTLLSEPREGSHVHTIQLQELFKAFSSGPVCSQTRTAMM